jgi:tRNA (guanine-N7-)-methyltransferase
VPTDAHTEGPPEPALPSHPPVRTFKPRRRRMSPERRAAYVRLAPQWSLAATGAPLDLVAVFGRRADVVLDIGFGQGEATLALASSRPDEDLIAVEVHTPGVGRVLEAIGLLGLTNVRVVEGDVLEFLPRLAPGSLAGVRIWFPDPWPKLRQRHRRIVRPDVVASLVDRLRVGGLLHLATDVADYAEAMRVVCAAEPRLAGGVVPRPGWRPETRYESRGALAGRTATDLVFRRVR